jgi:hypothetical protein
MKSCGPEHSLLPRLHGIAGSTTQLHITLPFTRQGWRLASPGSTSILFADDVGVGPMRWRQIPAAQPGEPLSIGTAKNVGRLSKSVGLSLKQPC